MLKFFLLFVLLFALLFLPFGQLNAFPIAQHETNNYEEDEQFTEASLYLFATQIKGDLGIRNVTTQVDASFKEILENLDLAIMGHAEHWHNKWSFLLGLFYANLSSNSDIAINGATSASISAEIEQVILETFTAYRIFQKSYSQYKKLGIDLAAGARYNYIRSQLGIGAIGLGLPSFSRKRTVNWIDPAVGIRIQYTPAPKWGTLLWLDYGGFGIEADNAYQAIATINYTFNSNVKVFTGWRHYHFKYSEGESASRFAFDANYTGPLIGLSYRF